jgi:hypothetical protein
MRKADEKCTRSSRESKIRLHEEMQRDWEERIETAYPGSLHIALRNHTAWRVS